jgi:ParB-like chromosome segregation protein Spo0J
MKIETVSIATLQEDPQNVRVHSKKNMEAIRASLRRFGQQKPLVTTSEGIIIAGNGTFQAANSLGWNQIEIVRVPDDWSPEKITAYSIADNRTSELGEWDYGVLIEVLGNFESDLTEAAGWDASDIKFLLEPQTDRGPKPAEPNATIGDSYGDEFASYQESETRSVLFDYPLEEYNKVIAQLDTLCVVYNVSTNSEAVKLLLAKHLEAE